MDELKSFNEIRTDLQRLGIARFYHQAVRRLVSQQFQAGVFGNKEPQIERDKKVSDKTWKTFWDWHLYKQMLNDVRLMDACILGERIVPKFSTKIIKNKEYTEVKFYPESAVKKIRVFLDEEGEGE